MNKERLIAWGIWWEEASKYVACNKLISLIEDSTEKKGFIILRYARPLIRFRQIMQRKLQLAEVIPSYLFPQINERGYKGMVSNHHKNITWYLIALLMEAQLYDDPRRYSNSF